MYLKINQILNSIKWLILLFLCIVIGCFCIGCSSTSAEPSAETDTEVETEQAIKDTVENQQEMLKYLKQVKGDMVNIQKTVNQSIKNIVNSVRNVIKTESTAIQKSQQAQFQNFKGNYESKQDIKEVNNSIWVFVALLAFLFLRDLAESFFEQGNTAKIFGRKIFKDWF